MKDAPRPEADVRGSFLTAHASADFRVGGAGPCGPGMAAPAAPFVEATGASRSIAGNVEGSAVTS